MNDSRKLSQNVNDIILLQAEISNKILEAFDTPAAKWLRELPTYSCPSCNKETLFKDGCVECMEKEEEI
jgi:hypothetical protein